MSQVDLVYRIFAIIFPAFSIVALGYFFARSRRDTDMSSGNRINMEIFTPALIFDTMSTSDYRLADYSYLTLGGLQVASIVLIGNLASILVIPVILWVILWFFCRLFLSLIFIASYPVLLE